MRRVLVLTALLALAVAPGADAGLARYVSAGGDPLSLDGGRGTALVVSNDGAILGSVRRGRVAVTDLRGGVATRVSTSGCERKWFPAPRKVVCIGWHLGFSALGGAWRVRLVGRGINASAVIHGSVTLDNGATGTYSIRGERPRPWPASAETYYLG